MEHMTIAIVSENTQRCLLWRSQLPLRLTHERGNEELLTPHGFSAPLHAQTFKSKPEELTWLIESQMQELAPLAQEFSANGLSAISLSSSSPSGNDDDLDAANLAEKHLGRVPYDPDPVELADRRRQYEWEQYILACGQSARIYVRRSAETGQPVLATNDRRLRGEALAAFAPKVKAMMGDRSLDDIENARAHAEHYQKVVLASMTPREQMAWATKRSLRVQDYLEPADTNRDRDSWPLEEEQPKGGPAELGLHWLDTDLDYDFGIESDLDHEGRQYAVLYEPSESELWPVEADGFAA